MAAAPELAETEVERLRALLKDDPDRWLWAIVILVMIRQGWNPPPPSDAVLDRILADMGGDVQDKWVTAMGDGLSWGGPRQLTGREKKVGANATLTLSERERQILMLLSTGMDQPMVAKVLGISNETVKTRTAIARKKLGATTTTQAVSIALRSGIIQ